MRSNGVNGGAAFASGSTSRPSDCVEFLNLGLDRRRLAAFGVEFLRGGVQRFDFCDQGRAGLDKVGQLAARFRYWRLGLDLDNSRLGFGFGYNSREFHCSFPLDFERRAGQFQPRRF
jgi:hypothetical protein